MWKYCKICCVNITIYAGSYKYLKGKKSTYGKTKKKTVATVPLEQTKWHCSNYSKLWVGGGGGGEGSLHQKEHCRGIASFYIISRKKSTNRWLKKKVHIEQIQSTVVFTHSPNKCHNIFTKHLFSVMISHSFIFYYFILTYKKLTSQ